MADNPIRRQFAPGGARRTAIQLVIASVIVGAFLAFWGVSPAEFWGSVFDVLQGVLGWLGDSVGEIVVNLATYLMFGAAIVLPIWLISRVLGYGGRRPRSEIAKRD